MHAAFLTAFLFALTGVCAAQASRLLGAVRANAARLLVALCVLALWAHTMGDGWGGGAGPWFFLAGAVGFGLGGCCIFLALRRIGSTLTLLIVECLATLVAAAIGWLWLGAALGLREMFFAGLILTGILIGLLPAPLPQLSRKLLVSGCLLAGAGAVFQAISFNVSRHAFLLLAEAERSIDHFSAAYQRLLGGAGIALVFLAVSLARRPRGRPDALAPGPVSPLPAPVWVGLNALFGPILGVTAMLWAIRLVPNPGLVQAVVASATLFTLPAAHFLEGTRPGWNYFLGCALALAGIGGLLWVVP